MHVFSQVSPYQLLSKVMYTMKFQYTLLLATLASAVVALPRFTPDPAPSNRTLKSRSWDNVASSGGERTAWPVKKDNLHVIPYCYALKEADDNLRKYVEAAIELWYKSLDGPPSRESGHSLKFEEAITEDKWCYYDWDYKDPVHPGVWNRFIDHDAVAIHYFPGVIQLGSTVGYKKGEPKTNGQHNAMK